MGFRETGILRSGSWGPFRLGLALAGALAGTGYMAEVVTGGQPALGSWQGWGRIMVAGLAVIVGGVCVALVVVGMAMNLVELAKTASRLPKRVSSWAGKSQAERLGPSEKEAEPAPPTPRVRLAAPVPAESEFWSPTPIVAWRAWAWTGWSLRGYWVPWLTSHLKAECQICDEVPGADHPCGIYAVREQSQLAPTFVSRQGRPDVVMGEVALFGLVVEHELGYRAERAQILRLVAPPALVDAVAARYPDVPVEALAIPPLFQGTD